MILEKVAKALGMGASDVRVGGGDSYVDRLSCSHSVFLLGILAMGVMAKQWIGEVPISCWCPAHFTHSSHCDFANKVNRSDAFASVHVETATIFVR